MKLFMAIVKLFMASGMAATTASASMGTPADSGPSGTDTAATTVVHDSSHASLSDPVENYAPGRSPSQAATPERKRPRFKSDLLLPLPSALVPGLGHYIQGDLMGLAYTGVAAAGMGMTLHALNQSREKLPQVGIDELFDAESWRLRRFILGSLAFQGAGFMATYSTFRLSVPRFQEEDGKYRFLGPPRESARDLLVAPFRFDHLLRPTTLVPLGLVGTFIPLMIHKYRKNHKGADWTLSADDFGFGGAMSYNAGVTEEAAFRGWLYPVAYQYMGENFWLANSAQSLVFAGLHYDRDNLPLPLPQLLMGFYLGWVTKRNNWSLSESIFIHSWWDMILLIGAAAITHKPPTQAVRIGATIPILW